jgi:hypothetical protein
MGNHATVIFRMRLSVFRNMPGFRDEASKVDFIACAHQLLEMGVSQQNALFTGLLRNIMDPLKLHGMQNTIFATRGLRLSGCANSLIKREHS